MVACLQQLPAWGFAERLQLLKFSTTVGGAGQPAAAPRPTCGLGKDMARLRPSDIWATVQDLSAGELLVILALADYGEVAYPSQKKLAAKCRMARTTVNTIISNLRNRGILTTKGTGKSLTYTIHLSEIRTPTCPESGHQMSEIRTGDVRNPDRDPNSSIQLTKRTRKTAAEKPRLVPF